MTAVGRVFTQLLHVQRGAPKDRHTDALDAEIQHKLKLVVPLPLVIKEVSASDTRVQVKHIASTPSGSGMQLLSKLPG
jgi:hypothetical protein